MGEAEDEGRGEETGTAGNKVQLQRVSRCRGAPQNRLRCGTVVVAGMEGVESRMGGKLGQGERDTGQVGSKDEGCVWRSNKKGDERQLLRGA